MQVNVTISINLLPDWLHSIIFIVVSEMKKNVSQFLTDFHQISTAQRWINSKTFDRSDF